MTGTPETGDIGNNSFVLTISDTAIDVQEDALSRARYWQAKKAEAGYAAITWPEEFGGLGGTAIQSVIYSQEEAKYNVPTGFFEIGLGMCIPTMMAWATKEQNERFVKPALYGEEVWCQLFSEPSAGSDVAGAVSYTHLTLPTSDLV